MCRVFLAQKTQHMPSAPDGYAHRTISQNRKVYVFLRLKKLKKSLCGAFHKLYKGGSARRGDARFSAWANWTIPFLGCLDTRHKTRARSVKFVQRGHGHRRESTMEGLSWTSPDAGTVMDQPPHR